jgi:hypothetical protein
MEHMGSIHGTHRRGRIPEKWIDAHAQTCVNHSEQSNKSTRSVCASIRGAYCGSFARWDLRGGPRSLILLGCAEFGSLNVAGHQCKRIRRISYIQRRVTSFFEFGLPSPPWMNYTLGVSWRLLKLDTFENYQSTQYQHELQDPPPY